MRPLGPLTFAWRSASAKVTVRRLLDAVVGLVPGFSRPVPVAQPVRAGGTAVAIERMRRRRGRDERGTSMADLMVGMAIGLVTLGIAMPQIPALMNPYQLSSATRVLSAEFSMARMKAIAQNTRFRVNFDDAAGTYQLEREVAADTWEAAAGSGQHELPSGITFSAVNTDPVFTPQGMLLQNFSVQVHGNGVTRTVSVNILGHVDIT